ncbi:MAG: hypothetical protein R3F14_37695 [Polyangiaceae bacterium]
MIPRPKEKLLSLSCGAHGKARYATFRNKQLAETLNPSLCEERCPGFRKPGDLVRQLLSPQKD